jgi:DsbC/DsbD-like thiol-disulfide interchange protein/thiol-disulfide isomerase/thioredoxin
MRFFPFAAVIGLLASLGSVAQAQIGKLAVQVKPVLESEDTRAGARVRLALRVTLPEGYHVQAHQPRDPALIPTVLTLEPPEGITIEDINYPAATELKQAGQSQPLLVYGREFKISVRARVDAKAEPGDWVLKGQLRYQACDEKSCYPPATIETQWQLFVERAAPPAKQHGDPFGRAGGARLIYTAAAEPAPTPRTIVAMTRAAMAQDFPKAEQLVKDYRAANGNTPEALLALSWLGRGALAAKNYEAAEKYAAETYQVAVEELKRRKMDDEANFPTAFGAAIEVLGQSAAARGARSEAVGFLNDQLAKYGDTSIHKRIQKNINLVSLEGTRAPALDMSEFQGVTPPTLPSLRGKVVLLFFWAHWCSDCKAQGPVLERLLNKYGDQGFTIIAPTQRFGYAAGGAAAAPDEELRYIGQIRETHYPWLANIPVPVSEANHKRYGVSSTPTLAVMDRAGVIRLYNPGQLPEARLDELIGKLVEKR